MGAVKVDISQKERQYSVKYILNDATGVKALLRDRHKLASRRFSGDMAASDIIIDLHSAMNTAGLTERQMEAIALVYGMDLTLESAGNIMVCTKQGVKALIDEATDKIAKIYQAWDYGEIIAELPEGDQLDEEEAV